MLESRGIKCIISEYFTFVESRKGRKRKYSGMKEYETMVDKTQFEVELLIQREWMRRGLRILFLVLVREILEWIMIFI